MRCLLIALVLLSSLGRPVSAQNSFPTPSGPTTILTLGGCLNLAGKAVPISSACASYMPVGPTAGSGAYGPVSVGTSSGSLVAANAAKVIVDITNISPTAFVCISIGAPATISGQNCGNGQIPLYPGGGNKTWQGSFVPTDQIFAIASVATSLTVGVK